MAIFPVTITASDEVGGVVEDIFYIGELLNANDYAALKALYNSTNGENWWNNTGWKDWDFNIESPPSAYRVNEYWHGVEVVDSRVTIINLRENRLRGTLPSELGSLSNLESLSLLDNGLRGTLPSELGSLSNLESLSLLDNGLRGTLPSELGSLSNLQHLILSKNSLRGTLPSELGDLSNLQWLWLEENSLRGTLPALSPALLLILENPPYVKTQIPDVEANFGENFNLDVSTYFGDINNNISSYGAKGLPNGLTINAISGAIGGTPTPTTEGTFTVMVTASDEAEGKVSDEFNIVRLTLDAND
ncbi:MAG: putative Ig domain-containing protein [Hormoscilla sp. GM102CHS1]|nr:putative Ig domain-containing protein [Hormoscilla sp. GM102CHS1]